MADLRQDTAPAERTDPQMAIAPPHVRYIKLGAGGAWVGPSMDEGRLYFGIKSDPFNLCSAGDWEAVHHIYRTMGMPQSTATSNTREMKDFYTLGADCLWITFARGHLWWGYAEPGPVEMPEIQDDGRCCYRRMIDGWRSTDAAGNPLLIDRLSTSLTQLASYRRTLCGVKDQDYLLRILNAAPDPNVALMQERQQALVEAAVPLIAGLHWSDFELFVELLLARLGWRRLSRLGGIQADIDLLVELPSSGERLAVQVKSSLDQATADRCCSIFKASPIADRFLIACHSPGRTRISDDGIALWDGQALATRAVAEGLSGWLIDHCR